MGPDQSRIDRREFLKTTATGVSVAAVGASLVHAPGASAAEAKPADKDVIWRNKAPTMEYARMGRTNYMVSRIVQGFAGNEALWRRLLAQGVNYWDSARGYGNSEVDLAPFLKRYRDKVWITSKATGVAGYNKVDEEVARLYRKAMQDFIGKSEGDLLALHKESVRKQKETGEKPDLRPAGERIAMLYSRMLDESLDRLKTDHVDAYFLHGVEIPWVFDCLEVWEAYEKAHKAGKVKHFGFSSHSNVKDVLAAAVVANDKGPWKIDLIMPGVNPGSFDDLRPELEALKKQDVGIIAMKTKGIANRPVDGREQKFKNLVGGREYNEWERAKLWMLHLTEGLIDGCIAAMKSNEEMEKDLPLASVKLSAEAKRELRALVKLEMAGVCHLCGDCQTQCPEHIELTNMVRYHAYIHQYNERDLARELYRQAGYNPAHVCSNCGKCEDACRSGVPITNILYQLSADLA